MTQKRYTLTVDFYIYADDDEMAIKLAEEFIRKQNSRLDNSTGIKSIDKTPFGTKYSRNIYTG